VNQELKHKWHSIYGQILFDRKLMAAWKQVEANKGCSGIDQETIKSFQKDDQNKIMEIFTQLRNKSYQPTPVKRVYILKKNGKKRPLGIPIIKDRIVQQSLVNVIGPKFETEIFHKWSCGYRVNLGPERTLQIILWNLERGFNHIYDCDIKGFFDNIPHKKLMKVLAKYIADGTVLSLIWSWLKAGYMEEGKYHDSIAGTPQGGVISPLLANVYLNELDWVLEAEHIHFVRYADDFLLFAKTEAEIQRAGEIAKRVLAELGLEVSMEKTRFVDFNQDDFKFIGFNFEHWRKRKQDGKTYFVVKPTESSWKDFKEKIKAATRKNLTLSKEAWIDRINPIIRGKVNYYLNLYKAIQANQGHGQQSNCCAKGFSKELHALDTYTRRRLRVAMIHEHPKQRKGWAMTAKWNIEFFTRIGLISANWLYYNKMYGYTKEQYIERQTRKTKEKQEKFIAKLKEKGREFYTPDRIRKINKTQRLALT
jgi:group II intron reverse transcriptase/maturase